MIRRIMAHKIWFERREYRNHILELDTDSGVARIFPFVRETPSTVFINGTVEARVCPDGSANSFRIEYRPVSGSWRPDDNCPEV